MRHEDYERQVKAQKDVKKFDFIHMIQVPWIFLKLELMALIDINLN